MKKIITTAIFCMLSQQSSAFFVSLRIPQSPQEDRCWCSISTLYMWTKFQKGKSASQSTLASRYGVGSYNSNTKSCPTSGLNVNQLADALEDEAKSWNFVAYSSSSSDTFAKKIVSEIYNDKQPVAVVGNTRYKNGVVKANQHYFLVDSFDITGKSYDLSKIKGFYMNDPAYNAKIETVNTVSPTTFISKSTFFSTYASNSYKNKYYLVED